MKLVVAPHDLFVGGSQINAIDLAAAVRDRGHEVIVAGVPGPLTEHVAGRGLRFEAAPAQGYRPAPQRIVHLARLARRERVDVIHGYEWPPCLDAYFGARLLGGVPVVCTVLSMAVSPLVPRSLPLIMGTEALADDARAAGFTDVSVGEPPIDTVGDHPGIDGSAVRADHGVDADECLLVTVSRLALDVKLDALERAIDAAGDLAGRHRVRLVIVGGGEAEATLARRAAAVNAAAGREVVTLVGQRLDPRPFYAAADVVLGMGSSALRAMAIGKPVIVQGNDGFSQICEPSTIELFLRQGFWGTGADLRQSRLTDQIRELVEDPSRRGQLGCFGRVMVEQRFSLAAAAEQVVGVYERAMAGGVDRRPGEVLATAGRAGRTELRLHDPRFKRARAREHRDRLGVVTHAAGPHQAGSQQGVGA